MPYIDFNELKAALPIDQAAELLGLTLKQEGSQFRTACPKCQSGGDRAIVLTPSKGLYYCFSSKKGGDVIGLAAHVLGVKDADAAHYLANQLGTETVPDRDTVLISKSRATAPQKTEGGKQPAPFDPQKFAAKLVYSEEVKELGISEEDAARLGVGFHPQRKKVYFCLRNPDGSTSGYVSFVGQLSLPPQWLVSARNVVALRRA